MSTKNNPGPYDCYAKAKPDEPMFVLLARDPDAPTFVRLWAEARRNRDGVPSAKSIEAHACAKAMEEWWRDNEQARIEGRKRT